MSSLLVIEDEPMTAAALAALLRRHGHEVACAGTPGEALRELRQHVPDLLILDLSLPRVESLDLLAGLAEEPAWADVPIVVYSGQDDPNTVAAAKRIGASDYIVKGANWDDTYQRIAACLPRETPTA